MEDARNKYADIIDLPHHQSDTRPKMSNYDRAAQFSPFAALTGHADSIKETARLTDEYSEPSEEMKAIMNEKLLFLMEQLENQPEITITFFNPDEKKQGGAYITITGVVKKIKTYERQIQMTTGDLIPIDMIFGIDGKIFSGIDY
ncbi:MAG: YolD-like family protein [Clostridiales bacterium]|nr:YolD-like family protein [Clostridiales bacterium]